MQRRLLSNNAVCATVMVFGGCFECSVTSEVEDFECMVGRLGHWGVFGLLINFAASLNTTSQTSATAPHACHMAIQHFVYFFFGNSDDVFAIKNTRLLDQVTSLVQSKVRLRSRVRRGVRKLEMSGAWRKVWSNDPRS